MMAPVHLAYLGPEGSHSHQAALKLLAQPAVNQSLGTNYELVACPSLHHLIEAVDDGRYAFGLLPVENALEGSVMESVEAIGLDKRRLNIVLEFSHAVVHCLIQKSPDGNGKSGTVETVVSHPQALAQCREKLQELFGESISLEVASSTSEAVRSLGDVDESWAAIGTEAAAEIYGMTKVRDDISDAPDNATRFLVVTAADGAKELKLEGDHPVKTFMCMGLKDRPGVLVDMLLVLKAYGVNMTRIESRPNRKHVGNYLFFIDVDTDLEQPEHERVKMYLEADTTYLKVLGPYYALGKLS